MADKEPFGKLNRPNVGPVFDHHKLRGYEFAAQQDPTLRDLWNRRQEILERQNIGQGVPDDMKERTQLEKQIASEYERFRKDNPQAP